MIGKGYLAEPFAPDEDGCVGVPDGPGLGIELDEAGLQEVLARPWSAVRGLTRDGPEVPCPQADAY